MVYQNDIKELHGIQMKKKKKIENNCLRYELCIYLTLLLIFDLGIFGIFGVLCGIYLRTFLLIKINNFFK